MRKTRKKQEKSFKDEYAEVLRAINPIMFVAFFHKHGLAVPGDGDIMATIHRCRLTGPALTFAERRASMAWLVSRGYERPRSLGRKGRSHA